MAKQVEEDKKEQREKKIDQVLGPRGEDPAFSDRGRNFLFSAPMYDHRRPVTKRGDKK